MILVINVFPFWTNGHNHYIQIHQTTIRIALHIIYPKGHAFPFVFRKAMPRKTPDNFILSMLYFHASP